jgi:hypothetical protein
MAPTQLSLGGGSNLNHSHQPNGAPYGGTAASSEESFTLNGSEMTKNVRKMKVSLPFTADDKVNPIPFMTMLLTTAKQLDSKSSLNLNDPMCSPIEIVDDIAKITNLDKYIPWTFTPLSSRNSLSSLSSSNPTPASMTSSSTLPCSLG